MALFWDRFVSGMPTVRELFFGFWNITITRFFLRWWPRYGEALEEGSLLGSRPFLAVFLPPAQILLGGLIGGWSIGYHFALSESLVCLGIFSFFGFLNAQLGALLWLGYLLGDLLVFRIGYINGLYHVTAWHVIAIISPLFIYYLLLALLLFHMPILTRALTRQTLLFWSVEPSRRPTLNGALSGLVAGGLVYFWTQAFPLLIRPLWTWQDKSPVAEAIEPIQKYGLVLIVCAVLGAMSHVFIQSWIGKRGEGRKSTTPKPFPWLFHAPLPLKILFGAAATTFLLSGVILRWWEAIVLFGVLFLLYAVRAGLFIRLPEAWVRLTNRAPLLLRLTIAIGVGWYCSGWIHRGLWRYSQGTFLPILVSLSVCLLVLSLFCPFAVQPKRQALNGGQEP